MVGIIVVFPKEEDSQTMKSLLKRNGLNVIASCTTGASAINRADDYGDCIIVCGYKLPDMLYSEILENVGQHCEMIVLASRQRLLARPIEVATLEMPLKVRDLINSVEMMQNQIWARQNNKKKKTSQRSPKDQAIVNQAKKALMEIQNLTEQEAHRYIPKSAMNSGCTMVETAKMISATLYRG